MSQGMRDMLANKKFAIPLIVLLGFCLVGLILVGIVLLLRPGAPADAVRLQDVAGEVLTPSVTPVELATFTPTATDTPTPRPTATLVPVDTVVPPEATVDIGGGAGTGTAEATGGQATATSAPSQPTATTAPTTTEGELAQTGLGWGLILFSSAGLAGLAMAARRLRLSGGD